jgi:hypothetical protein
MPSSRYRRFSAFTKKNRRARDMEFQRPWLEFSVAQQVRLVLAQVRLIELVWRTMEMLGEWLDGLDQAGT